MVLIRFSLMIDALNIFSYHMLVSYRYIFFGEMSVHILCPFFKSGFVVVIEV